MKRALLAAVAMVMLAAASGCYNGGCWGGQCAIPPAGTYAAPPSGYAMPSVPANTSTAMAPVQQDSTGQVTAQSATPPNYTR